MHISNERIKWTWNKNQNSSSSSNWITLTGIPAGRNRSKLCTGMIKQSRSNVDSDIGSFRVPTTILFPWPLKLTAHSNHFSSTLPLLLFIFQMANYFIFQRIMARTHHRRRRRHNHHRRRPVERNGLMESEQKRNSKEIMKLFAMIIEWERSE